MLRKGDTIGMIAPSGPCPDKRSIAKAVEAIEEMGLRVVTGKGCYERRGYYAGCDDIRAEEMNRFFADPAIHGIFCMRGGDGAARLLHLLDLLDEFEIHISSLVSKITGKSINIRNCAHESQKMF